VHKTIASTLPEGGSVEGVARALHVSVRTLQRKLVEIGTTTGVAPAVGDDSERD
jgi:hypothetical protein